MGIPRMRTAIGVLDYIRQTDPDTEITVFVIRKIINSGQVHVVCSGRKKLVDADAVLAILRGDNREQEEI